MRFEDFRGLVTRLQDEVPPEYLDGIAGVEVSPKAVPHPVRPEIYTLGECIPLEWSGTGADLQSRVVLYHGSFAALARLAPPGEFDWRGEAWETLTHELRHHLEWRANQSALEAYDWAAEQNFARHEGAGFDPVFYRSGEKVAEGVWKVDDDVFVEQEQKEDRGAGSRQPFELVWHGRRYRGEASPVPPRSIRFLSLDGVAEPPPGDLVLVLRPRGGVLDAFRGRRPVVGEWVTVADA